MAVELARGWNGWEGNMSNHSSGMNGDEMLALAGTIIDLPGLKKPKDGEDLQWVFKELANKLQTGTVYITKGIHEKDRLHFNVVMEGGFSNAFEVFVRKGAIGHSVTSPANTNPSYSPASIQSHAA